MATFFISKKFRKRYLTPLLLFSLVTFLFWGCTRVRETPVTTNVVADIAPVVVNEPIQPIPLKLDLDVNKVKLGDKLFHDPKLSGDDTVSCATCHDLQKGGTDRLVTSLGMNNHTTPVNSPTVYNSGFMFKQYWDGRAETLEEQVNGPIETVGEMGGMSWDQVVNKLKQNPEYVALFEEVYTDTITPDNVRDAIATFERSLYTPNAPFDQYLRGNPDAITPAEKKGYDLFKSYGCITCHQGMLLGGNMFQTFGVMGNYIADRGNEVPSDLGRYHVTENDRDRYVFKVPTLRNIVLTQPYFHDGSAKTLDEAIKTMGKYQLGVDIPQKDVDSIMQFLRTLTGEYQGKPL